MKKLTIVSGFSIIAMVVVSCGSKPNYSVSLKKEADSAGYYLGYFYSQQMKGIGDELNIDAIAKGWQDGRNAASDSIAEVTIQNAQMFLNTYFQNLQVRNNTKNLEDSKAWMEENKKKQGIVTMPSGLQYRIIQEGTGIRPEKEDTVSVVYHGTLIDGTVFDSSKERNDTVDFPVSGVVPGFSEALQLMPENSLWEVFIPAELGYGERVNPRGPIKPNSVLIFELQLIKVKKGAKTQ
ncbi:MAG: FKBP-type peptidyl-prolyl cis-trans isomerase [Bacteroidales bacterium]|jgi:FKBP-type peptidyl-prolyl cis-trans isomerase|nr:FKBP-type peptidyl-prolyl cis-trans isomerase [Bacteroidales bacterium]